MWHKIFEQLKEPLNTLAGKMTAGFAFVVVALLIFGLLGNFFPATLIPLVYIAVIGAMLIYVLQVILLAKSGNKQSTQNPEKPQEQDEKTSKPIFDPFDARESYLRAMMGDCQSVRLVGLDELAGDPKRGQLSLDTLYVSLDTTASVEVEEDKKKKPKNPEDLYREKTRPLTALEALATSAHRRAVLLGLPGTGKSTFVRYLTLKMAQAALDRTKSIQNLLPTWPGGMILPVIVPLGRLAESISADRKKGSADLIENFIQKSLESEKQERPAVAAFADSILKTLKNEGGLVLFDGLDEVADLNLRPVIVEAVEDFVEKYSQNSASRFLVTCRTYSYQDDKWKLTGWPTYELALLSQQKIEQFVKAWHSEHIRIDPTRREDYEKKCNKLLATLRPGDRRRLSEIAPFAIILTMMAVVHTNYGELPDTRAQVYEKCTDLLLLRWETERTVSGKTQKRSLLEALELTSRGKLDDALHEIAYKAHEGRDDGDKGGGGAALVTEDLLSGTLQVYLGDPQKVQTFLDSCRSSNGLLMLQGTVTPQKTSRNAPPRRVYAFPHLTFEEYLAGQHLLLEDELGKAVRVLMDNSPDRWREVIMLMGEHLCFDRKPDRRGMQDILENLAPASKRTKLNDKDWRALWLAGDLLTLYRRRFGEELSVEKRILRGLENLVQTGALTLRERASAADTLDELGYTPPDLYEFAHIVERDANSFYMAKHPLTNLQYKLFLDSPDFAEERFWLDFPKFDENGQPMKETSGREGLDWLKKAQQDKEDSPDGKVVLPRYWNEPRFGIARRTVPVVGITWWEANAFCKWLTEHWMAIPEFAAQKKLLQGKMFRLPTENEWVLAVGGLGKPIVTGKGKEKKETYRFPWDEDGKVTPNLKSQDDPVLAEILRRANIAESGINCTTPAGMYPLGRTKETGIWDMSGNVWEWQANIRKVKLGKDEEVWRGLRGGSWDYNQDYARVDVRLNDHPSAEWNNYGFRLVVCSPPS